MIFGRDDWTLFRNISTLGQKAGVSRDVLPNLAIKELADNALDAGAECKVGKDEDGFYFIEDDGPGIDGDDAYIAMLFSIKRPLTSTKLFRLPTRGALGNGLRVVAGTVLASGGQLRVQTKGRKLKLTPKDDGHTDFERIGTTKKQGTRVEIKFGPNLNSKNADAWATLAILFRGKTRYTGKTSPHWYDADGFYELCQAAGETSIWDLFKHFDSGQHLKLLSLEPDKPSNTITREQAEDILAELREYSKPKKPSCLGAVTEECVGGFDGYAKKTCMMRVDPARGLIRADVPCVIEVWASKQKKEGAVPSAHIFVNRTPITAEVSAGKGSSSGKNAETWITGCGLNHYFKTGRAPMKIFICVTAPYMPVTTDGKEPNLRPILATIRETIESATRKAKRATSEGKGPSKKSAIFHNMEKAIDQASGDGEHRFSLRQLFYAMRPLLQEWGHDDDLNYNYFSSVVTEYEAEEIMRDVPGMYRDTRGVLYHPHTGEQIALGTLNVEKYKRPEYRFNKVLYIEKGGFFPLLIDAQWAEKHDCALLTSQGYASRAARDVIDIMGDGDGELLFFCIHDADGPGTMIYESLIEATKARRSRRVEVINLGLDPWEAVQMGLPTEKVERARGRVPVAKYVKEKDLWGQSEVTDWQDWLQEKRVELNAMNSPRFIKWLDGKMAKHDTVGKVVPPTGVLDKRFQSNARNIIREQLLADLIRKDGLEDRVDELLARVKKPDDLDQDVHTMLDDKPTHSWEMPIAAIAKTATSKVLKNGST